MSSKRLKFSQGERLPEVSVQGLGKNVGGGSNYRKQGLESIHNTEFGGSQLSAHVNLKEIVAPHADQVAEKKYETCPGYPHG